MSKLPKKVASQHRHAGQPASVAQSALYAGGGFATTIASVAAASGKWEITDETARFAIVAIGVVAALALFVAAIAILRK